MTELENLRELKRELLNISQEFDGVKRDTEVLMKAVLRSHLFFVQFHLQRQEFKKILQCYNTHQVAALSHHETAGAISFHQ
jgi:hypothetical protein